MHCNPYRLEYVSLTPSLPYVMQEFKLTLPNPIRTTATNNFGSETKKATGMPIYMSIGQCGSVLGSHIFLSTEGPRYIKGFAVSCAMEFLAAVCGIILTVRVFAIESFFRKLN